MFKIAFSVTSLVLLTIHFNIRIIFLNFRDHHVSISRSHSSLYYPEKDANGISYQRAAARAVLRRSGSQGHIGFDEHPQRPIYPGHDNITSVRPKVNNLIYISDNKEIKKENSHLLILIFYPF